MAADNAEVIGTGGTAVRSPQLTPDGRWIVYVELNYQPASARVMRVPAAGGPAEQVMPVTSSVATADLRFFATAPGAAGMGARSFPDIRCPPRPDGSCVIAEIRQSAGSPASHIVVSAFDPGSGQARELAVVKPGNGAGLTCWDISPDGQTIAFTEFAWDGGNRIRLVTAGTGETRTILVKDFLNIADIAWAPDGRSLVATTSTLHGADLIRVMLDGRAVLLEHVPGQGMFAPRPSPDGRSVLVGIQQNNSNAWVIER
jgi:hypothetical protein